MCLSTALLLFVFCEFVTCWSFLASFNMAGITGLVKFDPNYKTATINLTGTDTQTCGAFRLILTEFPVMPGHFAQPCDQAQIGEQVFLLSVDEPSTVVNISLLLEQRSNLDAHSLVIETCNGTKACTSILASSTVTTWQARFYGYVAGNIYLRQLSGESVTTLLSDLVDLNQRNTTVADILLSQSSAVDCKTLLGTSNSNSLINVGQLKVGYPLYPVKSRLDRLSPLVAFRFALLNLTSGFLCSEIQTLEPKTVSALIDMRGIKGYITFHQSSPFDLTTLKLNLTNLGNRVGPYHVHLFPTPQMRTPPQNTCSNDNVGGHWNPFGVDTQFSSYPPPPGSTHDLYEVGDLSSRHGSLQNADEFQAISNDWNLPLFGQNSIVGRSLVLHQPNGTRFACASILYPGEVIVGRAIFQSTVVGSVLFTQLKNNPYSDVSVFLDLSYGQPNMSATLRHPWHIHTYPISTETDNDTSQCSSTGGHWNPYKINNTVPSYKGHCKPDSPFSCEVGDLSSRYKLLSLGPEIGKLSSKNFFTDSTFWLSGLDGAIGRSVVIHGPDEASYRIACANVTLLRFPSAQSGPWHGSGTSKGTIHLFQTSPQGPTYLNVSLTELGAKAGGYHIHVLPLRTGLDACSNKNIMGHFNPYTVNITLSPSPGNGTVDQYKIGDISGKFGTLNNQNKIQEHYVDSNMPLTGANSVIGRSLVIHYINGSRMQCADITADNSTDGYLIVAEAVFNGSVNGSITLSQQSFSDGSYGDLTLLVDMSMNTNINDASWYIAEKYGLGSDVGSGPGIEKMYNPFNITNQSASCSPLTPLACPLGDLTGKHGYISLTQRQLFTDTHLPLSGDFTVIYRALVLKTENKIIACADILPKSPSAQLIFSRVTSFSRYDFRKRVADVLEVHLSRVSILPGAPTIMPGGKCQQVTFIVSGDVNQKKLDSVKDSEKMGHFKQGGECMKSRVSGLLTFYSRTVQLFSLTLVYIFQTYFLQ